MGHHVDYLTDLTRRNLRPTYIYNQRLTLERLSRYLHPECLCRASLDQLTGYLDSRPQTPAARGVEIAHLRGFYGWAYARQITTTDISRRLIRPRSRRSLPRPMPEPDIAKAFTHAEGRTLAILAFALYAGLRGCEIAQLRAEDIGGNTIIVVESKGGGMSSVPLAPRLASILSLCQLPTRGWLFPRTDQTDHLSRSRIGQIANRHLHELEIDHTLHTLRHTFGTWAYRESRDLRATQELMRHQSPAVTAGYTWTDPMHGLEIVGRLPAFAV